MEEICEISDSDKDFELPKKKLRSTKKINFLNEAVCSALDRFKISSRAAIHVIIPLIEALGLDSNDFVINRTSLQTQRTATRSKCAKEIKENFNVSGAASVLHFDGKMINDFFGHKHEHRLAVLVSSSESDQLLGVPEVKAESGKDMSEAIYDLMVEWGIVDLIMAVSADTTNSNTGRFGGAIVRLEQLLGRDLLYLACRHHVHELLLRAAFESKFGKTTGVDVPLFAKFKKAWSTFDLKKYEPGIKNKRVKSVLQDSIEELVQYCSEQADKNFNRADYKELLDLTLLFLGIGTNAKFRVPGAMHHARWISKAIYCLKMYLFRKQFKLETLDEQRLEVLCIFIIKYYVKAWISCESGIHAPNNDLHFLKAINSFQSVDRDISGAVVNKLSNHLWYLSDECIAFAIFDENVSVKCKREMSQRILETDGLETDKSKKYQVKRDGIRDLVQSELSDFVTDHTIDFFNRFKLSTEFLKLDPTVWQMVHLKWMRTIYELLKQ